MQELRRKCHVKLSGFPYLIWAECNGLGQRLRRRVKLRKLSLVGSKRTSWSTGKLTSKPESRDCMQTDGALRQSCITQKEVSSYGQWQASLALASQRAGAQELLEYSGSQMGNTLPQVKILPRNKPES